jgi:hypothetical protein
MSEPAKVDALAALEDMEVYLRAIVLASYGLFSNLPERSEEQKNASAVYLQASELLDRLQAAITLLKQPEPPTPEAACSTDAAKTVH